MAIAASALGTRRLTRRSRSGLDAFNEIRRRRPSPEGARLFARGMGNVQRSLLRLALHPLSLGDTDSRGRFSFAGDRNRRGAISESVLSDSNGLRHHFRSSVTPQLATPPRCAWSPSRRCPGLVLPLEMGEGGGAARGLGSNDPLSPPRPGRSITRKKRALIRHIILKNNIMTQPGLSRNCRFSRQAPGLDPPASGRPDQFDTPAGDPGEPMNGGAGET